MRYAARRDAKTGRLCHTMRRQHTHLLLLVALAQAEAWRAAAVSRPRSRTPQACICINCKWVDRCATYHWVEKQHEQQHVAEAPDFEPDDPQSACFASRTLLHAPLISHRPCAVQVFIRNEGNAAATMSNQPDEGAEGADGIQAAVMTTEFDVFQCASFSEEQGKWIRLMPNAGFVPT